MKPLRNPGHRRMLTWLAVPALAATLVACGGSDGDEGPIPLYAGTYFVVLNKTVDNCGTGVANRLEVLQTVSQSGRSVTLTTGDAVLQGQVDPDDLGISTASQVVDNGVLVTTTMVYRASNQPGLFGAGFSVVADAGNVRCTAAYSGQAQLQ
ncbi:MAG: hypothetical protein ACK40L_17030 [Hydrogenophaga sp.]